MIHKSRFFTLLVAAFAAFTSADSAHSQNGGPYFTISVSGGPLPIINGTTDLPDGTSLFVNLKKPWLPDGAQGAQPQEFASPTTSARDSARGGATIWQWWAS